MKYAVTERLIHHNRGHKPLKPVGLVVHSTVTPGATDEAEQLYFDKAERGASAHYFADWDSITRCIPENERAWHAGPTANAKFLSIEMCEPSGYDPVKFALVWGRAVWFVADCCLRYGWGADHILSHDAVSKKWHETNHTDPIGYFVKYGHTWANFVGAVSRTMSSLRVERSKQTPIQKVVTKLGTIFKDLDDNDYSAEAFKTLKNLGIFHGDAKGNVHPDDPIKRKDLAIVIHNLLKLEKRV
ncbi:MAG TPA: N-acetylmuramoyl-L-alanine amidase [Candidatus Aquicultor sp.]